MAKKIEKKNKKNREREIFNNVTSSHYQLIILDYEEIFNEITSLEI